MKSGFYMIKMGENREVPVWVTIINKKPHVWQNGASRWITLKPEQILRSLA